MDNNEAVAKLKAFLEATPPNCAVVIPGLATQRHFPVAPRVRWIVDVAPERLQLHCDVDDGVRRFGFDTYASNRPGLGFRFLEYSCRDCGESTKTYALVTELKPVNAESRESTVVAEVMKLGEYPPFGAPIAGRIQKLLDTEDLELYRNVQRQSR